jgi:hypothetical protein
LLLLLVLCLLLLCLLLRLLPLHCAASPDCKAYDTAGGGHQQESFVLQVWLCPHVAGLPRHSHHQGNEGQAEQVVVKHLQAGKQAGTQRQRW